MKSVESRIGNQNVQDILSLTPLQEGMLFHYLNDDENNYFEQLCLKIHGTIDVRIMREAWDFVIAANEMLRTIFRWEKLQKPVQVILKTLSVPLRVHDLTDLPKPEQEQAISQIQKNDQFEKIDLRTEPFRVTLILLTLTESVLMISNHHILYDGWSNGIILKELFAAYTRRTQGLVLERPVKNKFREFIKWLQLQNTEHQQEYWTSYLAEFTTKTQLPPSFEHQMCELSQMTTGVKSHIDRFDADMVVDLKQFAMENRITLATLIYCVWGIVLQRYSNTDDVLFGTTVSGRNAKITGLEEMVGLFINTVPLRVKSSPEDTILTLLHRLDRHLKERMDYEHVPLVHIQQSSTFASKESLFDTIVVIENYPLDKQLNHNHQLTVESYSMLESTNYDLTLVVEVADQITLQFAYNPQRFAEQRIQQLSRHFFNIFNFVLAHPEVKLSQLEMLSNDEKDQLLYTFNATSVDYPREKTIHQLFEEQAALSPDQVAVVFGGSDLTYSELNLQATQLARVLQEVGIKRDRLVGIYAEPSLEMVVGILAILKSGGAYLPIDPDYPEERIEWMIDECAVEILLTQGNWGNQFASKCKIIDLMDDRSTENPTPVTHSACTPESLAYIIYTSGSTGKPKGVMVEHRSVVRLVKNTNVITFQQGDKLLHAASLAFDVSTLEIWGALLNGLELHVGYKNILRDGSKLEEYIVENQIDILLLPAALFNIMVEERLDLFRPLKYLQVGGDVLSPKHVNRLRNVYTRLQVVNGYGPTENTTVSTCFVIDQEYEANIPIGKPISNSTVYILDQNNHLCPLGVFGEICVGGDGLARGYVNNPALTAERFVKNPFLLGERIYRTGDRGRWLSDGKIEFLGRIDQQVKIRGYRIEPGEIENQLLGHEAIKEVAVIVRIDAHGAKYLCTYFVAERELSASEIRAHLAKYLPDYMIPGHFLQMEKLPLSKNGKIDRKALSQLAGNLGSEAEYVTPTNRIEEKIVAMWKELLGAEQVGIHDNFFALGGHSLKVMTLVAKLHRELDVQVPLREVFQRPTVKELAHYIQKSGPALYASIQPIAERAYYETSSAQQRIYLLQQLDLTSTSYNMPGVLEMDGILDLPKVEQVFKKLIKRHETLRTSFETIEEQIVQRVHMEVELRIECIEKESDITAEAIEEEIHTFVRAFDLRKAPLCRIGVIRIGKERDLLLFDMHHIISDGVSMGVLIKEFGAMYNEQSLDELRLQYKDYAAWQRKLVQSDELKQQEEYWLTRFATGVPVLQLPTDYPRPSLQDFAGDQITVTLGQELIRKIKRLANRTDTTLYMVLLSGINILLAKYSQQEEIIIGSPIAGRSHADLENSIGMFVNTLAIKNHPIDKKSYRDFLQEVKETALKAFENQDYPFEELVDKLNSQKQLIHRDVSRNPLFDVMFVLQNVDLVTLTLNELTLKPYHYVHRISKFDLTILADEATRGEEEAITLHFEYSQKLFRQETVERMASHLVNILNTVTTDSEIVLGAIEMLSEREKATFLYSFNQTQTDYPAEKTVTTLFAEQVEKTPQSIAVVLGEQTVTYQELHERVNHLAMVLMERGVKPETIIGIVAQRSPEMIMGIMAILKAGGAFLPLDPEQPVERTRYMISESKMQILLSEKEYTTDWIKQVDFLGEVIDLRDQSLYHGAASNLGQVSQPHDLAYIIFTSGSTGQPKGVMIEHQGLTNYIVWAKKVYLKGERLVFPLYSSLTFDLTLTSIFVPLISGSTIRVYNQTDHQLMIQTIIEEDQVDLIKLTPAHLQVLRDLPTANRRLKRFIVGGEELHRELAEAIYAKFAPNVEIYNEYGPTETVVGCMIHPYNPATDLRPGVPIGVPADNVQIYLLDRVGKPVATGVTGEVYISGDGVARGYLNRPDLTGERFVENPFIPGKRMYKTGDVARFLQVGTVEFVGRIDHQVKIRGFRIELGEIESRILQDKTIKEAIVIDRTDQTGDKYLCAYVVATEPITSGELSPKEVKDFLRKSLPEYMVPTYVIQMDQIPLTQNGKIDRTQLPEPDGTILLETEYEAPRNTMEVMLAGIWKEILGVEQIGIHDNFFELGGHSLKATILVGKIHQKTNIEIPLREIFKTPTIKGISAYMENATHRTFTAIETVTSSVGDQTRYYETSPAQKRIYMLQQFDLQNTVYNMPGILKIYGRLDITKVEYAFQKLIKRHETLRTSFELVDEKTVQKINPEVQFAVEVCESQNQAVEEVIKEFIRAFDLSVAPLIRAGIIRLAETESLLLFDMHHIISDGVSMAILVQEFAAFYEDKELAELRIQYKDYAAWQNRFLHSDAMKKQEVYWLQRFSDEIPVMNLPTDYPRPTLQSFAGDRIHFVLDPELTLNLNKLVNMTGSTLYMVLLSGVNILFAKYTGQEDLIIGSPVAGRPHPDLENMIGMFVNTLAMRNQPVGNKSYIAFLEEVKDTALAAYENQDYQFDEFVECLNLRGDRIRRDLSRNPLFDVMFILQNVAEAELRLPSLEIKPLAHNHGTAKFDLTLSAQEVALRGMDDIITFDLEYSTTLWKRETVERMASHLINIFNAITANPGVILAEIEMLSPREKDQLLYEFNNTAADYPRQKTLHQVFVEQVERKSDNIAVVWAEEKITYREFNDRVNCVATILREKGVQAGSIVGLMAERSLEMLVGIFGILKAGGTYLPITPHSPADRINWILKDSQTQILVTQTAGLSSIEFGGERINLSDEQIYSATGVEIADQNCANDIAYVIYTSGSTGKPKGVLVEHQSVLNILTNLQKDYPLMEDGTYLLKTTYTFDVSVTELFGWFWGYGRIAILPPEGEKDINVLIDAIENYSVTHINFVPSMLNVFLDGIRSEDMGRLGSLRYLFVAGEAFPKELVKRCQVKLPQVRVENIYGPTEATIYVTRFSTGQLRDEVQVPIGKPLHNVKAYVLSKYAELLPVGVPGELCLAGECLARGYHNQPELTAEKFQANPFIPGTRMYRTCDRVRWMPDGNLEFLGRIDHQVKIRGYRIELGEIESQLVQYEPVKEAVVVAREDRSGAKYLCAYLVAEEAITVGELREFLLTQLPEYMVPSVFVKLAHLPLNANGKIDRKALPEPDDHLSTGRKYVAPGNSAEETLAAIWSELLHVESVGIEDHFFELGGHSLKATILAGRIHQEFDVEVPLKVIFQTPTIRGISTYIQQAAKTAFTSILSVPEVETGYYETSPAQRRIYTLQQFDLQSTVYNLPGVLVVEGRLDVARVKTVCQELVNRHENLRTSFETRDETLVQKIHDCVQCVVEFVENPEKGIEEIVEEFIQAFDLGKAPLLRVKVVKLEDDRYILMFDLHHIISDGTSIGILIKEFTALYAGEELAGLRIQYKDYANWQNRRSGTDEMKKQETYWLSQFRGEIPVLNLPTDEPRPALQTFDGSHLTLTLNRDVTQNLKRLAKETDSSLYMVLLSGVNILLARYSGQEDLVVGSPIAGRPHPDLENVIGMFVNTLAMRNQPEGGKTYRTFLEEVKENALKAFENQDYQYEELVEHLQLKRDLSRNPLFDVMFSLQNMDQGEFELQDIKMIPYPVDGKTVKFDLSITASEGEEEIALHIGYNVTLFYQATIRRMLSHLQNILTEVAANAEIHLHAITLLTEEERVQIFGVFNNTKVDFPGNKTIPQIFEEQVHNAPDRIAIVYQDQRLTYRELNVKANRLAKLLRTKGVQADSIIGLLLDRSLEMMIGIFAILKAGGAYLPISAEYPEERFRFILADSNAKLLLTQSKYVTLIALDVEVLNVENEQYLSLSADTSEPIGQSEGWSNESGDVNLPRICRPDSLAYAIYTSGSTGQPKGVVIEHRSLINTISHLQRQYPLDEGDTILQCTVYTFDASVRELFWWFFNGSRCYLPVQDEEKNPRAIVEIITREAITVAKFVPVLLAEVFHAVEEMGLDQVRSLKYLLVGGEAVSRSLVQHYFALFGSMHTRSRLINVYGPSEATIHCTEFEITSPITGVYAPIGKPIANDQLYILDQNQNPQAIGIPGEIYISGVGLAREYLNNASLTAERYCLNPFNLGERMYKTGDLARWLPDGNIEFIGRLDHQVKIRGYRIELGEIESCLMRHSAISEAVVLDKADQQGVKFLCAYYVADTELSNLDIRQYLAQSLPEYMIPAGFVQLERLPLTLSGKIDRKALPDPERNMTSGVPYEAPRNLLEAKLVKIWQTVLAVDPIGIDHNFFEVGGHSLKATLLIAKIHQECNVQVPLREFFKKPTIRELAHYLANAEQNLFATIKPAPVMQLYPVSSAQRRIHILWQLADRSLAYNMPSAIILEGEFEQIRFERAIQKLVARHESLRTSFTLIDGEPMQRIHDHLEIPITYLEVSKEPSVEWIEQFIQPFTLTEAPLCRAVLVKYSEQKHLLFFDMHHIISDGISRTILIWDFADLYAGRELSPLRVHYKDVACWQRSLLQSELLEARGQYWLTKLEGFVYTELPQRNESVMEQSRGTRMSYELDEALMDGITEFCSRHTITRFVFVLAVFKVIIMKMLDQADLTIGIPVAGRGQEDLEQIIGVFLNVLVIRSKIENDRAFADYLLNLNEDWLEAQANQDYPYEHLYTQAKERWKFPENSLFAILFNYMPYQEEKELVLEGMTIKPYPFQEVDSKYSLTLYVSENRKSLSLNAVFARGVQEYMVDTMLQSFSTVIKEILQNDQIVISQIFLAGADDVESFTEDFEADFDNEDFF